MVDRRTFLKSLGTTGAVSIGALAGCTSGSDGGDGASDGGDGGSDGGNTTTEDGMDFRDGELDMNISPSVPQDRLEAQYAPIRNHLSEELDIQAKMSIANNYSVVIQALGSGTSDLAETGPFAAALGVNAGKAKVILQRKGYGSWTYVSQIAASPDSDISNLSDLAAEIESSGETKIAFSDRLSTSGCLYPLYDMATEADIDVGNLPEGQGQDASFTAVFAGGHTASYEQLANGQVTAACMGGFVSAEDGFSDNATVIHKHEGLPRAPIVVSPKLSDEEQTAIKDAFLNAPDSIYLGKDGEADTDDDLWFNAVREADVDTYQSVIDVANELGVGSDIFQA